MTSASATAARASWVTSTRLPVRVASSSAWRRTERSPSKPGGDAPPPRGPPTAPPRAPRPAGRRGELLDDRVAERARNDAVDPAAEVGRHVADRFALAEPDIGRGQVDGGPAELGHPRLERDPGAQRRLLEDHRQRPTDERRRRMAAVRGELGLQLARPLEERERLVRAEVGG